MDERPPSPYLNLTDATHPVTIINFDMDDKSTSMPAHAPQPFQSNIDLEVDSSGIVHEDVVMDETTQVLTSRTHDLPAPPSRGRMDAIVTVNSDESRRTSIVPRHLSVPDQTQLEVFPSPSLQDVPAVERSALDLLPSPSENRLVLNGGWYPLITNSPDTGEARSDSNHDNGDDGGEPDPKRPRTDEFDIALSAIEIPRTYAEAIASHDATKWKEAIRSEIQSHICNHTWDMVTRPHGLKVIGCKWVFSLKSDETGKIIRYKVCLVARGFLQTLGFDYSKTYSPVASMNTVRAFLALCCRCGYLVKQYDIKTAFFNGELSEMVFMDVSEGIRAADGQVCRLRRSLYRLKQASAVWYETIRSVFSSMGFQQCRADMCLFVDSK
ncbi:hypothetical protein PsorP6_007792 [Peronosclerospora sorghi]|uniref:Uncharacterized protein n=1 Tax=Peronosclerospora sorghi TaxID=230839 RepID=A0ACC0WB89_9STRA|nr:hypothetical protein PsorP6_007792 [Peronosclerospora sorghi]